MIDSRANFRVNVLFAISWIVAIAVAGYQFSTRDDATLLVAAAVTPIYVTAVFLLLFCLDLLFVQPVLGILRWLVAAKDAFLAGCRAKEADHHGEGQAAHRAPSL